MDLRRHGWVALFILPLALLWDFYHFLGEYRGYHDQARAGVEQITAPPDPREVIVVLTGDIGRIPRSLELLKVRGSSRLIVSGAGKGVKLASLVNRQGPDGVQIKPLMGKITLDHKSSSTVENALYTRSLLNPVVPGRLILVTSDYHMGRSLAVFRSVFPEAEIIPFSVPSRLSGKYGFHFFWRIGGEYWKSLVYRLSLWLGI